MKDEMICDNITDVPQHMAQIYAFSECSFTEKNLKMVPLLDP
jgi:hypothetical protein